MNESTLVPREEMSDLDWLARNVHVWPAGDHQPWCYVYWKGGQRAVSGNCITVIQPCVRVEMSDWLARRAELQNKPSWEDHPDAKCFVQNSCGHWWKNTETGKVEPSGEYWRVHDGVVLRCASTAWVELNKGELLGDWRDTIEKRPEQTIADICREVTGENRHEEIFEPFVSVEDAKITIMQSDGDVKHFGGIIDRSILVKEDSARAKQSGITQSKYTKTVHGVSVDVYDVLQAWGVSNPALQHLIKKALQCGQRGHKDNAQDLQDIIDSAIRAKELES